MALWAFWLVETKIYSYIPEDLPNRIIKHIQEWTVNTFEEG